VGIEYGEPGPRDPDAYSETAHVQDSLEDPMRFVTRDLMRRAIREGRECPDEGEPGSYRRRLDVSGVDVVVVLSGHGNDIITTWTEVSDWARALASDRWSQDDLSTIRSFMDREHKRR